jgi:hypothetical protein
MRSKWIVFKTNQMLLLTSPAKAREKEEVRRTALPSALYTKRHVHLHVEVGRVAAIGRLTMGPPDRTATAVHRITDRIANRPTPTATQRKSTKLFCLKNHDCRRGIHV